MRHAQWLVGAALCGALLGAAGCADLSDEEVRELGGDDEADEEVGSMSLALSATSPSGKVYRLRNASFTITGPRSVTLRTPAVGAGESETFLRTMLLSGDYSVQLQPGFQIWRIAADGSEGLVTA